MQNDGGNGGHQHAAGGGAGADPKVYVATTLAALVLAGSAYIWKSGSIPILKTSGGLMNAEIFRKGSIGDQDGARPMPADAGPSLSSFHASKGPVGAGDSRTSVNPVVGQSSPKKRRGSRAQQLQDTDEIKHDATGEAGEGSTARASRPKERRRRGKDPTKELVKSGKLNSTKVFASTGTAKSRIGGKSPSPSSGQTSTTPRPYRRASRSPSQTLSDNPTSASLQRSLSRPRSGRQRGASSSLVHEDPEPVFTFDSLTSNRDIASTSSASSTAATEATTASSASTAPSSATGATNTNSDETPKTESIPPSNRASSALSSNRHPPPKDDPSWDWDRGIQFNSIPRSNPASQSSDVPRFRQQGQTSNTVGGSGNDQLSSEVQSPNHALPSILTSEDTAAASSSLASAAPFASSLAAKGLGAQGLSLVHNEDEQDELSFPTLNNPRPSVGPSSASSFISPSPGPSSVGTGQNSGSPSVSRPQSRASSSSAASSSKGKGKNSRSISGLTSLSTRNSSSMNQHQHQRRAPTPLDAPTAAGRPSTPSSSSLASTHPPPSPSSSYCNHNTHSPSASVSGNSSSGVAVSAQTQLASLRGALEAARLREEKSRSELEKVTKDVDALRWENAASRRREGELQAQLQQVMLQMQSYATYFAAMNQQAQQQQQPGFQLQLPPAPHHPASSPPQPAEIVTLDSQEDLLEPSAAEQSEQQEAAIDAPLSVEGDKSTAKPPIINEETRTEQHDGTPTEQPSSTPPQDLKNDTVLPLATPPLTQTPLHPSTTILPFAPQPLHGGFPGSGIPLPLHSPFLLHHPGTPSQSPLVGSGPHSPFTTFPSHHPHPSVAHPHYPFMGVGLSGVNAPHMPPLQSPIHHPGMLMMSPHLGTGFAAHPSAFSAGPASPTNPSFRPMTPATHGAIPSNMGIGLANGGAHHQASPLWMMNGFGGSAAGSVNGSVGGSKLSMSPASGPSSPLPPYLQHERGRKGWTQPRSRPSSVLGGLKGDLMGDLDNPGRDQREGDIGSVDDDLDEGEVLNPMLADAILKRPASIRINSKRSTSSLAAKGGVGLVGSTSMPGFGGPTASPPRSLDFDEVQPPPPSPPKSQPDQEEVEEVMFPSLSELGNVAREKRVGTPAHGSSNPSSRPRSALSTRPVVSAQQNEFGDGSESIP